MAFRGSNYGTTTGTSTLTVTVGGYTIQQNDIILAFCDMGGGSGTTTCTYPTGFNPITGISNNSVNASTDLGMAYKVATASEPSSYTFTLSNNDFHTIQIRVYSGRNTSSPFSAVSTKAGTSSPIATPAVTSITGLTAVAGDDVAVFIGTDNSGSGGANGPFGLTGPTGFANQLAVNASSAYSPIVLSADYVNNPGGATGTLTPTITAATSYNTNYGAYVLSLAGSSQPLLTPTQGTVALTGQTPGRVVGNVVTPGVAKARHSLRDMAYDTARKIFLPPRLLTRG